MSATRLRYAVVVAFATLVLAMTTGCLPGGTDPEPDSDPPGEQAALAHAQCMRDHGFDWPDPAFVDGEWETHYEGIDLESPAFEKAEAECQEVRDEARPDSESVDDPEERARVEEEMERMLQFATCMRDQGIDFPDPVIDDDGNISGPAGPLDGDQEAFDAAREKCEDKTGESMP